MRREDTNELMPQTQELIQKSLNVVNDSIKFVEFDRFLLERFLTAEEQEELQDTVITEDTLAVLRECAYRHCYQQIRKKCPVARATLRSWFHVGGSSRPSRNQMIAFAFALDLSKEELQEYFICGLQEPGIQINDYQEMIFCYGLESGLSYEECQDMIEVFEQEISKDTVLAQTTHTDELWSLYEEKRYLPKEDFLIWMCENGFYFKGYSKVALNCFMELKHEILEYIREVAKGQLMVTLKDVGFIDWAKERGIPESGYGTEISRFLHNILRSKDKYLIDKLTENEIRKNCWIVYSSKDKNSDLLAELYSTAVIWDQEGHKRRKIASRKNFDLPESVYFMTDKYVSQLIGVAQQKEKEIRLSMARSALMAEKAETVCPEWVQSCMEAYGVWKDTVTVGETRKVLDRVLRQQKQRCQLVKRSDLLPLIHYVAQKRYEQQKEEEDEYVQQEALDVFVALSEEIFSKCQMMELDDRYQLDYLFCSTYGEQEMFSLSDVIEVSVRS